MYSFPSMNEQCQQAGAASQATSYYTQNVWRNQQAGNKSNSCRYNTVRSGLQQPQGSNVILQNGGYGQMSVWQMQAVSHEAVRPQQLTEVKNDGLQALRANGEKVLPNSQIENTGRVPAHRSYGNMNQGFTDSASVYTTTTLASYNQTTHGSTVMTDIPYDMQASQSNQFKQINACHGSNRNVFWSNLATSQHSINNGNAMYLSTGQNLRPSNVHQKAPQYPSEPHPAYNYGGTCSNVSSPGQHVLVKSNGFNDSSSHLAAKKLPKFSSRFANGSGPLGPPPPYSASGYNVQQYVKCPAPEVCVSQDNSRLHLQEQFKSNNFKGALKKPYKYVKQTVKSLLTSQKTNAGGAQRMKAGNASPSGDNKILKQNPAVSFSDSSQVTTAHFSSPINGNQSPRYLSDTFQMTVTPSLVKPNDCSTLAAAPGTKVIAVVQPLPCESFQACSNSTSPDTNKECTSAVAKIAAWLREELDSFSDKTCGVKSSSSITTNGGGLKEDSHLSDLSSSPQSSVQESQLDNDEGDAQQSVPSPTLESTKSPRNLEAKEMSSPAVPKVFILRDDDVYTEPPYKSSWLNVNEQLDDIDKEFGFPWSLMCQYYKHESDYESDDESDGKTDGVATDGVVTDGVVTGGLVTSGLVTAGVSSPPESETSNRISSQTQFSPAQTDEASSPKSENDGTTESFYSFKLDVLPPEVAKYIFEQAGSLVMLKIAEEEDTGSSESKLEGDAPDPNPSGSLMSKQKLERVHTASNETEKTQNHIELIDLTANDQFTEIIISDDDEDLFIVEKKTPTKMPEPVPNLPAPEEMCEAPVQINALESPNKLTNCENDDQAGCEQSLLKCDEVNEPYLDFHVPVCGPEDLSSNESFEIQKAEKCKQSDVDSQHDVESISKPDKTFVDAPAAGPSRSVIKAVQLALYGSSQKEGYGNEPPAFLSVFLSPLKRKSTEDVCSANKPVKQRILEKWRDSLQPVKTQGKKSSAVSLKTDNLPVSSKKTGMVDQRDRLLKRRKVVKKNLKKYAVKVKDSDDCGKSEPKNENQDPSTIPENIILKFTVLPNTFDFKDQSETMEGIPAAKSAKCELSVKKLEPVVVTPQSHSEAVNKAKVTWNMNHSKLLSQPPFPKTSVLFQEFQKKHQKKTCTVYR